MLKKINKLIKSPAIFFRDYFLKKNPIVNNETGYSDEDEIRVINTTLDLFKSLESNIKIDVVYTWVDDKDELWAEKCEQFKIAFDHTQIGNYAIDKVRFENSNELLYSLLSIKKNIPWVNKIYIITDMQTPSWLGDFPNAKIIDHKEIIELKYLPTYNSHVIEANLHKIPELAEHFIYFNDDVFVARELPPQHFFYGNGLASLFLTKKSLTAMQKKGVLTPTLSASMRSSALLKQIYALNIDTPLVHTYVPLRKSMFELAYKLYGDEINNFSSNKFRSKNDLNLATFLVPWLAYCEGLAAPAVDVCYYFNVKSPAAATNWKKLLINKQTKRAPHSFCANNFKDEKSSSKNQIEKKLNQYYLE